MPIINDPTHNYGNLTVDQMMRQHAQAAAGYGDEQAYYTQMRASYGAAPAGAMSGAMMGLNELGGGITTGASQMFSGVGSMFRPITYVPPARVALGTAGMYAQDGGFKSSALRAFGIADAPAFGVSAYDFRNYAAEDIAERTAAGAASSLTLGAGLAAGHFGLSALTGLAGSALGAAVGGPLGMAVGGFLGRTFGGEVLGLGLAGSVNDALSERMAMQNYMAASSFRYVGAGSGMADPRRGAGMSREARREATEFIREMEVNDPTLGMGDLMQVLQGATQKGLLVGAADMKGFQTKFRDVVSTLKDVTKILNQSLEEGLETLKSLKGIGVEPLNARGLISQASSLGMAAGRTGTEMLNIGLQGAELFRGTGVSMNIGMQAAMMNVASVRAARDAGVLSQEAISQAGGEEALAQRMVASGMGFSQSAFGRGYAASFYDPATGGFNAGLFGMEGMGGGGDFIGMAQRAARNLSSPAQVIRFQANQAKFMSDLGQQFGGTGLQMMQLMAAAGQASRLSQVTGASQEDAFRYAMQNMGLGEPEIEANMSMLRTAQDAYRSRQKGALATRNRRMYEEAEQNNLLYRAGDRVGDWWSRQVDRVAAPINRVVDDVSEGLQTSIDRNIYGIERVDVSGTGYDRFLRYAPSSAARDAVGADISETGMLARTSGSAILSAARSGALGADIASSVKKVGYGETAPDVVFAKRGQGGNLATDVTERYGMDRADFERAAARAETLSVSDAQARRMYKAGALKKISKATKSSFQQKIMSGAFDRAETGVELLEARFGKPVSEISRDEVALFRMETQDMPGFQGALDDMRDEALGASTVRDAADVSVLQKQMESLERSKDTISDRLGLGYLSQDVFTDIVQARADRDEAVRLEKEASRLEATTPTSEAGIRSREEKIKDLRGRAKALYGSSDKAMGRAVVSQTSGAEAEERAEIRTSIKRFVLQDEGAGQMARGAAETLGMLASVQTQRGQTLLTQAGRTAIYEADMGDSARDAARSAFTQIERFGARGLMSLSEKQVAALNDMSGGEAGVGSLLLKQREALLAIQNLKEGADPSEVREALSGTSIGKTQAAEIARVYDEEGSEGKRRAIQEAYSRFRMTAAGDQATSGPGAGGRGTEQGTANDTYVRQTAINAQILSALTSIAGRLGVQ